MDLKIEMIKKQIEVEGDLLRQYRQQQEKYIYYIVALSVASIGFSVYTTLHEPIKLFII